MSENQTNKNSSNVRDLQSLLRRHFGDRLIVVDHLSKDLVPLGENFGSDIMQINAKIQRTEDSPIENIYLVAKTVLDVKVSIDWTTVLKKEVFMYDTIVPFYKIIENESGIIGNDCIENNFPLFYGYRLSLDPNVDKADKDAIILMENLKVRGYYVASKKDGLDMQHTRAALTSLARFHALGLAAQVKRLGEFESIKSKSLAPGFDHSVIDTMYVYVVDLVKREPRFKRYAERIEAIHKRQKGDWKYELLRHELWSTITHNDFWTNNIMFHEDELARVDGVKFIDFQTYCYADVSVDLLYFLFTSLSDEVKLHHFDEVIDVYYAGLISNLKRLGVDVADYSRQKFDDLLRLDAGKVILRCAMALKFFMADVDDALHDRESVFLSLMTNKPSDLYYERLEQLLRIYDEKDWMH